MFRTFFAFALVAAALAMASQPAEARSSSQQSGDRHSEFMRSQHEHHRTTHHHPHVNRHPR
jgi:hypothetical protein